MRGQRWIYVLMIVVAAGLGVAIAGVPSRSHDVALHVIVTTTTSTTTTTTRPPPPTTTSTTSTTVAYRRG